MTLLSSVLKHSGKYLTGSAFAAVVGLLMNKYYTGVFKPEAFGILAFYLLISKYIATFTSLGMESGATRFYFDYKNEKRDEYLSTIFWFITCAAAIVLCLSLIVWIPVADWISPKTRKVYLVTVAASIASVYVNFLTRILYNEHRSSSVLMHGIAQTTVSHTVSFLLIFYGKFHIMGRMFGQFISYTANALSLLAEFKRHRLFRLRFVYNKAMAKESFFFSLPVITSTLLNTLFIYTDRIFLKHFFGNGAVGIYSFGFIMGSGLTLINDSIFQTVMPKTLREMNTDYTRARDDLESFSYRYYALLMLATLVISMFSPMIVSIFSNDHFKDSSKVMPFVMAGFMMGGFYKIPSVVVTYNKYVRFYPLISVVSFGTGAILNWIFIPSYGVVGAAYVYFVGLFLYSMLIQYFASSFMSRRYNIRMLLLYALIFTVISCVFFIKY